MTNREEEISDVVLVLDCATAAEVDATIETLKSHGLRIDEIDYENAVVEGNIEADGVKKLHDVPSVRHVRSVFSYLAEHPEPGNPSSPELDDDEAD